LVAGEPFNPDNPSSEKVCSWEESWWTNTFFERPFQDLFDVYSKRDTGLNPYQKIINLWLLNFFSYDSYGDVVYCYPYTEDSSSYTRNGDCKMINNWWTDGTNYFIPWYRLSDFSKVDWNAKYYVINDQLYKAGDWEFAGIENYKIIFQRLNNIIEYPETMTTSFTLETCEINL
jgi:hypothetical protein